MGSATIRAVDASPGIRAGEFVALLGASGSGKSSLLNLIAGLDSPTSGSVRGGEQDLASLSRESLAKYRRHTVGMVFQSFNLIPSMTVLENVELPLRFEEVARDKRARCRERAERWGWRTAGHRPIELWRRATTVALARALVNQSKYCWPTSRPATSTAAPHRGHAADRTLNESLQMTVVLVTHETALAEKYAGRLIFLADGKLVSDQPNAAKARGDA